MDSKEKEIRHQAVSGWLVSFCMATLFFLGCASVGSPIWGFFFGYLAISSAYHAHKSWFGWRENTPDE